MKNDIGKKKWHRMFGWCTITHHYTPDGGTLVNSEHKHIQQYIAGRGWVDYVGTGKDGHIESIFMNKSELHDAPLDDSQQALFRTLFKVLK